MQAEDTSSYWAGTMASLEGYERRDSTHTSVLGFEIPLGDWSLALKKRNK